MTVQMETTKVSLGGNGGGLGGGSLGDISGAGNGGVKMSSFSFDEGAGKDFGKAGGGGLLEFLKKMLCPDSGGGKPSSKKSCCKDRGKGSIIDLLKGLFALKELITGKGSKKGKSPGISISKTSVKF